MNIVIDEQALHSCGKLLTASKRKLACVESMTAGFLSSVYAMEVRSGDYFLGSIVCYDDTVKESLLGVPAAKLKKHCAESAVATLRILDGLRAQFPEAHVYVSVTGLAYETENPKQRRPIGTVYYAFGLEEDTVIYKRKYSGNAAEIIIKTCNGILNDLSKWLTVKVKEKAKTGILMKTKYGKERL